MPSGEPGAEGGSPGSAGPEDPRLPIAVVNALDRAAFVARFGGVFERSPWVAEAAWRARPFAGREALRDAMVAAVEGAPPEARLALIRAHPDLAGADALADRLTDASRAEQRGAALDRLSASEATALDAANAAYRERFGFPFVICVRGHTPRTILAALRERLPRSRDDEVATAIGEIGRIGALRLEGLVREG